jgi:hypothetical protein
MPTCRSISLELRSQFDIEALPEFVWSNTETKGLGQPAETLRAQKSLDEKGSVCNVYVPVYPKSQFWIVYSISPPIPDGTLFLFKLFFNNEHVISWSCGKDEDWKGKTMFGLFEKRGDRDGKNRVEKRVLSFAALGGATNENIPKRQTTPAGPDLEVRVFRAHGRKRIPKNIEDLEQTPHLNGGQKIE